MIRFFNLSGFAVLKILQITSLTIENSPVQSNLKTFFWMKRTILTIIFLLIFRVFSQETQQCRYIDESYVTWKNETNNFHVEIRNPCGFESGWSSVGFSNSTVFFFSFFFLTSKGNP